MPTARRHTDRSRAPPSGSPRAARSSPPRCTASGCTTRRRERSCRSRAPPRASSSPTSSRCSRSRCRRYCSTGRQAWTSTPNSNRRASASSTSAACTTWTAWIPRPAGIAAMADPRRTRAAQRPARFLRVEKPVSLPDRDVLDFRNSAFGVTRAFGMREILGYAPVEPDGSVRVKVPANVAFAISILDANGRRIGPRHNNWLQVRPGEELRCNGCHDPDSGLSHGRSNLFKAVNAGATTPACRSRTRARRCSPTSARRWRRRARASAARPTAPRCSPSTNVVFEDVWTDPAAAGGLPDASFAYSYVDLVTPAPTSRRLRHRMALGLPHHDQLRAAHPPAVEPAAGHAGRRRRDGARRRHVHDVPHQPFRSRASRRCRRASSN